MNCFQRCATALQKLIYLSRVDVRDRRSMCKNKHVDSWYGRADVFCIRVDSKKIFAQGYRINLKIQPELFLAHRVLFVMAFVAKGEGTAVRRFDTCAVETYPNMTGLGRTRTAWQTGYLADQCQISPVSQQIVFRTRSCHSWPRQESLVSNSH